MAEIPKIDGLTRADWLTRLENALPRSSGLDAELSDLAKESDDSLFFGGVSALARRASDLGHEGEAAALFRDLSQAASSEPLRERARQEFQAMTGGGSFGQRVEFLLPRISQNASDPRFLVPALGASLFARTLGTGLLGRLLQSDGAWWTRGWGARGLSGLAALAAESLVWTGGARVFSSESRDFTTAFLSSALTLSVFHGFGSAARRWSPLRNAAAMPLAILGAAALTQDLEARLGLAPRRSGPAAMADVLGTFFGLGLSSTWARALLGARFSTFQSELALRSEAPSRLPTLSGREPVFLGPRSQVFLSEMWEDGKPELNYGRPVSVKVLKTLREIPNAKGEARPFFLLSDPDASDLWTPNGARWVGRRLVIAERDGREMAIRVDRHEVNPAGDPITPEGVTKLQFYVEEGETRGRVFTYFDKTGLTLYFIDLEEPRITGGPAMKAGAGSILFSWLAEQAQSQRKNFNVTRITSEQTVKILRRQGLIDPERSRVEACTRLHPEDYDEEYRVEKVFPFSDLDQWRQHGSYADFFNVHQSKYPEAK